WRRFIAAPASSSWVAPAVETALRQMPIGEVPHDRKHHRLMIATAAPAALLDLGAMRVDVLPVDVAQRRLCDRRVAQHAQAGEISASRARRFRIEFRARRILADHPCERTREADARETIGAASRERELVSGLEFRRAFHAGETDALVAGFSEVVIAVDAL